MSIHGLYSHDWDLMESISPRPLSAAEFSPHFLVVSIEEPCRESDIFVSQEFLLFLSTIPCFYHYKVLGFVELAESSKILKSNG
jgi:hypothetical protein